VTGGFSAWLPEWYGTVLAGVDAESRWVAATLPELHPTLELMLVQTLFSRIDKAAKIRLTAAIQGAVASLLRL
jgi:hypothetical protein